MGFGLGFFLVCEGHFPCGIYFAVLFEVVVEVYACEFQNRDITRVVFGGEELLDFSFGGELAFVQFDEPGVVLHPKGVHS